jgi:hypothetical protein
VEAILLMHTYFKKLIVRFGGVVHIHKYIYQKYGNLGLVVNFEGYN